MTAQMKLNIGRVLLVIGLVIGLESLSQTFKHIGDPRFLITPQHPGGIYHGWYHVLREAIGDLGNVIVLTLIFFMPKTWRTPATWWIGLVVMVSYFLPFWAGMPFIPELRAPTFGAELRHILQAALALIGLFIARAAFFNKPT